MSFEDKIESNENANVMLVCEHVYMNLYDQQYHNYTLKKSYKITTQNVFLHVK